MRSTPRPSLFPLFLILAFSVAGAADDASERRDPQALDILNRMHEHIDGLASFSVSGEAFADARLDAGLIVTNPEQVEMRVARPDQLKLTQREGGSLKELFFSEGRVTVFDHETKFYAQAEVPREIGAAVEFALEDFGIEAPLLDFIQQDIAANLAADQDEVLYLGNSTIRGVMCHHLAIRDTDVDVQLWISAGDAPLPRRLAITSKWEGGSPRFVASLDWNAAAEFPRDTFTFQPPEDAVDIGFVQPGD